MKRPLYLALIVLLLTAGCQNKDERLAQMAERHEARQAEQNQRMADLQKQVAEGSKRLVEEDAKAREALTTMQSALRADQSEIGKQRDALEADRREIAVQRNRDPIVAAAIMQVGLYAACLLPLVLAGYMVWATRPSASQDDAIVSELLVTELAAEHPLLLAPPEKQPLQLQQGEDAEPTTLAV
jgi:hypothetical protein